MVLVAQVSVCRRLTAGSGAGQTGHPRQLTDVLKAHFIWRKLINIKVNLIKPPSCCYSPDTTREMGKRKKKKTEYNNSWSHTVHLHTHVL